MGHQQTKLFLFADIQQICTACIMDALYHGKKDEANFFQALRLLVHEIVGFGGDKWPPQHESMRSKVLSELSLSE